MILAFPGKKHFVPWFYLGAICLLLLCRSITGQVPPAPTVISVTAKLSGAAGQRMATLSASVIGVGRPVTEGQVDFWLNGKKRATIQVVGQHPAATYTPGTATLILPLPAGTYAVVAKYVGSSSWGGSSTQSVTFSVPSLSEASLLLQTEAVGSFGFKLTSPEPLGTLAGDLTLKDLTANSALGSSKWSVDKSDLSASENTFPFTFTPSVMAVSDLRNTGLNDLVVGDATSGSLAIYLQQVNSSWILSQSLLVGFQPTAIVIADLNADGLPDLAITCAGSGSIAVLLQDGTHPGLFLAPTTYKVGGAPVAVVVDDVNLDGLPDLVIADFTGNYLVLFLNRPEALGSFNNITRIPTPGGPSSVTVGSFTGRGSSDLAVTNYFDGSLSIFPGGTGAAPFFGIPVTVNAVGAGPTSIVAADLNGDGLLDLAVSNALDGSISVLLASANYRGAFPTQYVIDNFVTPTRLSVLTPLEQGAPIDLAVSDGSVGNLTLLRNAGDGTFPESDVLELGQALSSSVSIYDLRSGASLFAALDPSLRSVHFAQTTWEADGLIQASSITKSAFPHQVQAVAEVASSQGEVPSNVVVMAAAQLTPQSISFPAPLSAVYGGRPLHLVSKASSGLPVSYSVMSGPGVISDASLLSTGAGSVFIAADQPGNDVYAPATTLVRVVEVTKAPLTISPATSTRAFGAGNPGFSGTLMGVVGRDAVNVAFFSGANALTAPGAYSSAPLGISGTLLPGLAQQNYAPTSLVGELTIVPNTLPASGSAPNQSAGNLPPIIVPSLPDGPSTNAGSSGSSTPVVAPTSPASTPPPSTPPVVVLSSGSAAPVGTPVLSAIPTRPPTPIHTVANLPNTSGVVPPAKRKKQGSSTTVIAPLSWPLPTTTIPALLSTLETIARPQPTIVVRSSEVHSSALLLLRDGRLPMLPGWVAVSLTLHCQGHAGKEEKVILATGQEVRTVVSVPIDTQSTAWLKLYTESSVSARAHFTGSASCAAADSQVITIPEAERPLEVPYGLVVDDLIFEDPVPDVPPPGQAMEEKPLDVTAPLIDY